MPSPTSPSRLATSELSNGQLLRRLLGLAWKHRLGSIVVTAQQAMLVALSLASLGLAGLAIDVLRADLAGGATPAWPFGWSPPANWSSLTLVTAVALCILVLAVVHALLRFVSALSTARLTQQIVVQLRSDIYDKLQRLSFRFFDANQSGSIINRVTGDAQAVRMFVDGVLIRAVGVLLLLVVYLIYMLRVHVGLTLACLATTPLLWWSAAAFARKVRPDYVRGRELVDKIILALTENVQGMSVVKGFAQEDRQVSEFSAASDAIRDHQRGIFWRLSLFQPASGFLTQINMMVLLAYGGYLVIQGEIRLGEGLFVFANLLSEFANQVGNITNIANSIQTSLTGAQRVFEVLDAPLEVVNRPNAIRLPRGRGDVRFEDVWFGYNDEPVLRDIQLAVEPGERIAIVGPTGAGKSTLLSLIPRFYDVVSGQVLVDGVDVRDIDLNDLRRNVGLVFQESFLFSNTIAENIAFGHPDATPEQIERAAGVAAAHEFIVQLPEGYQSIVGEQGCNLSGGQRQRLAIARAVLLDPPILILDDATSAVDPQTEQEILEAMERAMHGRTTFLIAHRQSTLRRADRVVVLDQGRIVQMGTPNELMRQEGLYRELAHLQMPADRVLPADCSEVA